MSDNPKKKVEGNKISSDESKPNIALIENAEPSSNPGTLSTPDKSSAKEKKMKTGMKTVLPGAVAQSVAANKEKSSSLATQNNVTKFVADKEDTRGSDYRRRKITTRRAISTPISAGNKKVPSEIFETSLVNSDPSALIMSGNSSGDDSKTKTSRGLKADLPGAVKQSSDMSPLSIATDTRARNYRRRNIIYREIKNPPSNEATTYGDGKALAPATMELNNSEPSTLPDSIAKSHSRKERGEEQSQCIEGNLEANYESNDFLVEPSQNNTGYISRNNAEDQGLVVATLVESDRNVFQTDVIVDAFLVEENPGNENPTPWYKDRRNLVVTIIVIVAVSIAIFVTSQLSGDGDIGDDVVDVLQSITPSTFHSNVPTRGLSLIPSYIPTYASSVQPTLLPTTLPTYTPTTNPSLIPSYMPTRPPTLIPSYMPTRAPTLIPSYMPTNAPTLNPQEVLQLLFVSTNGPSWSNTWDFTSAQSYCEFYGITCDDSEQITGIDLGSNNLRGPLTSEMGLLSSLLNLDLRSNSITGTIPSEIGMLSSLTNLRFADNSITGTIPSEIEMLSSLDYLRLNDNSIRDTIPSEIGLLSSLLNLNLFTNSIRGTIPSEIGLLSSLTGLYLDDNSITGTIPSEIGMLSSLTILELDVNSITGTTPSEIGKLSSLTELDLRFNSITGTIPTELCALTNSLIFYDESEISCTCSSSIYIVGTPCNSM